MMVSVGIDVSKDKHDCFIVNSEGEVLADVFTIPNNMDGFHCLLQRVRECTTPQDKIKVGLEATGHYSYNLLGFLLDNGLATYVLNPLRTNLYRKSLSLRKTKTDRVDARTIAIMLLSDAGLKPYTNTAYHNEELKSLTRYRFDKVKERATGPAGPETLCPRAAAGRRDGVPPEPYGRYRYHRMGQPRLPKSECRQSGWWYPEGNCLKCPEAFVQHTDSMHRSLPSSNFNRPHHAVCKANGTLPADLRDAK